MARKLSFISMVMLFISNALMAQTKSECMDVTNTAFNVGEKITYRVVYNWNSLWLNAGEATFTVEPSTYNNQSVYHLIGEGTTYKSYDWFYKVRDKYESYVDIKTLQPQKFIRNVNEGGYIIYNNVTFKHTENKAISTNGTFKTPNCIQDVLSVMYWARNIDFDSYKANDTIPITIFLDDSVYPLYIRYLGKQNLATSNGTYRCIVFRPLLVNGTIFSGGEKMVVYVTDDKNKIPIQVESSIAVGTIKAQLIKYDGLRNEMTAKIK